MQVDTADYVNLLRMDFNSFIHRCFLELNPHATLRMGGHIDVIASKLEACRRGEIRRLIITLPPRHLKSHCASIAFPAFVLGHDPASHIICASYGQDLAEKLAHDCRTIMRTLWYRKLFGTRLAGRTGVSDFETTFKGSRTATSVGGVLTGRGAEIIIIDDPMKPDEALSQSRRKSVIDWYENTLQSRLNDKNTGSIVIVMQRLHQDDLIGHVMELDHWEVVNFPAIALENETHIFDTPFGRGSFVRRIGEPLQAERESLEKLAELRRTIGEYNFAAQYQQSPTPLGGAMVKTSWLKFYDEAPKTFSRVVMSWDTANKSGELNDYSVCTVWAQSGQRYDLLEVIRRRLEFPELVRTTREIAMRHPSGTILIEDKASGTQLIQELRPEFGAGLKEYKAPQGDDKIMRLHNQTLKFENGCVWLPKQAAWLENYVAELTGFPGTKFDDQVNSTTQALDYMSVPTAAELWARIGRNTGVFDRLLPPHGVGSLRGW